MREAVASRQLPAFQIAAKIGREAVAPGNFVSFRTENTRSSFKPCLGTGQFA